MHIWSCLVKMRKEYLVVGLISLVVSFIFRITENSFGWIALGFGSIMLLFGVFSKAHSSKAHSHKDTKREEQKVELEVAPEAIPNPPMVSDTSPVKSGGKESIKPRACLETDSLDEYSSRGGPTLIKLGGIKNDV